MAELGNGFMISRRRRTHYTESEASEAYVAAIVLDGTAIRG